MKRFTLYLIGFYLVVGLVIYFVVVPQFLLPKVKIKIEETASAALNAQVSIGNLRLRQIYPLSIEAVAIKIYPQAGKPSASVAATQLRVKIDQFDWNTKKLGLGLALQIEQPKIVMSGQSFQPKKEDTPQETSTIAGITVNGWQISLASLEVKLVNGQFEFNHFLTEEQQVSRVALEDFSGEIKQSIPGAPFEVHFKTQARVGGKISLVLPMSFSSEILVSENKISSKQALFEVAGLKISGQGESSRDGSSHQWSLLGNIDKLEDLPVPPEFLPPGKWSGSVSSSLTIQKSSEVDPLSVEGHVELKNIRGQIDQTRFETKIKGQVALDAMTDFVYKQELMINKLSAAVNLDQAEVSKHKIFYKPVNVALNMNVNGSFNKAKLYVQNLDFALAQLKLSAQGQVDSDVKKISELNFNIPLTELSGFEKFILPLAQQPVTGSMQAKGKVKGVLSDYTNLEIELLPLSLRNVNTVVDYEDQDAGTKIQGPLRLDFSAHVSMRGQDISGANIDGSFDLTKTSVQWKKLLQKPGGSPFLIKTKAKQKQKNTIVVEAFSLTSNPLILSMNGVVSNPQNPQFDLQTQMQKLDFGGLVEMFPAMKDFTYRGTASGRLRAKGNWDFKGGIEKSPITLTGLVNIHLPKYERKSSPVTATPATTNKSINTAPVTQATDPLVLPWPIFSLSQIGFDLSVGTFVFNDLPMQSVKARGELNQGKLNCKWEVGKVFNGQMSGQVSTQNLQNLNAKTNVTVTSSNIKIEDAILWSVPEWKGLAKGLARTNVQLNFTLPVGDQPIQKMQASGDIMINPGEMQFASLFEAFRKKIASIPGIGNQLEAPKDPMQGVVSSQFSFQQQRLFFKNLKLVTTQEDELTANGNMDLNKNVDMEGIAFLSHPPVKGSVLKANQDAKGRLQLPFKIKGNLLDPSVNFAEHTISELLKNTLAFEQKKLLGDLKSKSTDQLKKEVNKKLKDLFGK